MKNLTKGIAAVGALAMLTGVGACGSNTADDKGQVYFLNNKPEVVNQWNELAEMYTKQTGVKVDIQSATSGSYESTLSSELAKNNAPTMFGIGGFDQYGKYKDFLEPLLEIVGLPPRGRHIDVALCSGDDHIPFRLRSKADLE